MTPIRHKLDDLRFEAEDFIRTLPAEFVFVARRIRLVFWGLIFLGLTLAFYLLLTGSLVITYISYDILSSPEWKTSSTFFPERSTEWWEARKLLQTFSGLRYAVFAIGWLVLFLVGFGTVALFFGAYASWNAGRLAKFLLFIPYFLVGLALAMLIGEYTPQWLAQNGYVLTMLQWYNGTCEAFSSYPARLLQYLENTLDARSTSSDTPIGPVPVQLQPLVRAFVGLGILLIVVLGIKWQAVAFHGDDKTRHRRVRWSAYVVLFCCVGVIVWSLLNFVDRRSNVPLATMGQYLTGLGVVGAAFMLKTWLGPLLISSTLAWAAYVYVEYGELRLIPIFRVIIEFFASLAPPYTDVFYVALTFLIAFVGSLYSASKAASYHSFS